MDDTAKYLIHADIVADGVVERSDVVGAIFGQTEGLLGEELDLRDLQQSSKVGRIDVEIGSESGRSTGTITIATSLDKVETAILAASLETISRVGPCRSTVSVTGIEDVREAKRREVVDRAKELLTESFDDSVMDSADILEEVRESVRVEDITEYAGYPAGPRVADSDAIIVVEGRADVLNLLRYGVKNAVAVEGTNVPEPVADLTQERTVTAFFDGDRGGELILKEFAQVGDVDYVAFAPEGKSVEDLDRQSVMAALRSKVAFDQLPESESPRTAAGADAEADAAGEAESPGNPPGESRGTTESPAAPTPERETAGGEAAAADSPGADRTDDGEASESARPADDGGASAEANEETAAAGADAPATDSAETDGAGVEGVAADAGGAPDAPETETETPTSEGDAAGTGTDAAAPATLRAHVAEVVGGRLGVVRLLGAEFETLEERPAEETFEAVEEAEETPHAVVVDGEADQRVVDVAAQRGVAHVVARSTGEFVKKPLDVRVRTAAQFANA